MSRLFAVVLLCAVWPAAAATLAAGSGSGQVDVTLAGDGAAVSGVGFDVEYDAVALSVEAAAGPAASAAAKTLSSYEPVPGKLRILVVGANQTQIADGAVVSLAVTVKTSAAGLFALKLSNATATDGSGTEVPVALSDGSVSAESSPPRITSVVHAATGQPGMPAGGWVTIYGSGFAASERWWSDADLADGRLPDQLLDVSVEIGVKHAYVAYAGPGRLEVLAPAMTAGADMAVRVVAPQGASDWFPAACYALAPGFFVSSEQGGRYAQALRADGSSVRPDSPARPGETVLLSGTGFGATVPQAADGMVPEAAPLEKPVSITIGGSPAVVQFAGIVAPGRYQFNVVIPDDAAAGDQEVVAEIGGIQSPAGRTIAIAP